MQQSEPRYSLADIFSGPGGLSLGFKLTGRFVPVAAIEANTVVADTYERNTGVRVIRKEITGNEAEELLSEARKHGLDSIDALVGGPPCRPFTGANKGSTRWEAVKQAKRISEHPDWGHFLSLVKELKPRAVVAENVMGFKTRKDVFSKFVDGLHALGYSVGSKSLHAEKFNVPQSRTRIFIVAVKGKWDECSLLPAEPTEYSTVSIRKAISDLPELTNDSSGKLECRYSQGRPTAYQRLMRNRNGVVSDHIAHSVHKTMARRFAYVDQGENLLKAWKNGAVPDNIMQATYVRGKIRSGFSKRTLNCMHSNIYRRLEWDKPSCTITHVRKTVLIHPLQHRLLSVREAARLQSFPDWFRFCGSTSQKYQQIADAVPPLMAKAIAAHLSEILDKPEPIPVIAAVPERGC